NGDRARDLVLGGGNVLLGDGDGNFGPPITTAVTGGYVVVADFNGDGRPDEALTGTKSATTVTVLFNDGIWERSPFPPLPPPLRADDPLAPGATPPRRAAPSPGPWRPPPARRGPVQPPPPTARAPAGGAYRARSGPLSIPAGKTTATITVPVIGDRLGEPNET